MRVLMVSDFYLPYVGGVEQHVRCLAHGLVGRGHDVAVVTLRTAEAPEAAVDDDGVRVHRIRGTFQRFDRLFSTASRPWAPPWPDPELVLGLRRVLAAGRPDVVHGHDWMARSAAPLCAIKRIPLVSTLHYYSRTCAKKTLVRDNAPCPGPGPVVCLRCAGAHYGSLKGAAIATGNWIGRTIEDGVAGDTIAVSQATARGNQLTPRRRWRVIPNMLPDALPAAAPPALPDAIPAEPYVLYVGDLRMEKGIHVLFDAYRRLDRPPPLVLVGEAFAGAPDRIPPGAIAVGPVPHEAIAGLWAGACMGVVPSFWEEPFGIVALEAMAAGCPVVASRAGGLAEIIDDGRTGLLVPPRDPAALAAAMERLLADVELRRALAAAASDSLDRYRADAVVAAVERRYLDALR